MNEDFEGIQILDTSYNHCEITRLVGFLDCVTHQRLRGSMHLVSVSVEPGYNIGRNSIIIQLTLNVDRTTCITSFIEIRNDAMSELRMEEIRRKYTGTDSDDATVNDPELVSNVIGFVESICSRYFSGADIDPSEILSIDTGQDLIKRINRCECSPDAIISVVFGLEKHNDGDRVVLGDIAKVTFFSEAMERFYIVTCALDSILAVSDELYAELSVTPPGYAVVRCDVDRLMNVLDILSI